MLRRLDDPDDLRRYLDLRDERDRIDAALAEIAPRILAALEFEDGGRAEAYGVTLEACVRRTYTYSDDVTDAETYAREVRALERSNGLATLATATGYVRVTRSTATASDHAHATGLEATLAARQSAPETAPPTAPPETGTRPAIP